MSAVVEYQSNQASAQQIAEHLLCCDAHFVPPLSGRVEISSYAQKLAEKATRVEAWVGGILAGLVAAYDNDQKTRSAYITSVSVLKEWTGQGIAERLMKQCVAHATFLCMRQISLEVAADNTSAIRLYEKIGFIAGRAEGAVLGMSLYLKSGEEHEQQA